MAVNTILWALSYPDIRQGASFGRGSGHLDVALEGIAHELPRDGPESSPHSIYKHLIAAASSGTGQTNLFVVHSPSNHPTHHLLKKLQSSTNVQSFQHN